MHLPTYLTLLETYSEAAFHLTVLLALMFPYVNAEALISAEFQRF